MLKLEDFNSEAHKFIEWITKYFKTIEKYPVKSQVKPKEIYNQLPDKAPEKGENVNSIFEDFKKILLPGITHWQSPNYFAYFPANSSYPSVLGEMLTASLAAQCMKWETSPAATELEEKVMQWLKDMLELPPEFDGVIQDTASTSTLAAILTAREKATNFKINEEGFSAFPTMRVYCSTQTHSSIDKAVKIAGIGLNNLVKVVVDEDFQMIPDKLDEAIEQDKKDGFLPVCVVATLGTTSTTAIDPLEQIAKVCQKHSVWLHVDAAYAGNALILSEYRWMIKGLEKADSFVFNPHKWLFTNFDCSAYFVKDKKSLVKTFQLVPEYLKSDLDKQVNNYSDWGIQLGRRFRALKLWFVIRNFGVEGLRKTIRNHIEYGKLFEKFIKNDDSFELLAPRTLNLVCFRYNPGRVNEEKLNKFNKALLANINKSGKMYVSHTVLRDKYALRFIPSQTYVEERHINDAWKFILTETENLLYND